MTTPNAVDDVVIDYWALDRIIDVAQVSGTGRVAYAIELAAGRGVLLVWTTRWKTLDWRASMQVLTEIHGHQGKTRIVHLNPLDDGAEIRRAKELLSQVHGSAFAALEAASAIGWTEN